MQVVMIEQVPKRSWMIYIGLTNEVQFKGLRIKNNYCEAILTSLRAQMPKDAISLAKQYIKRRWEILVGLQGIITQRENWREETGWNLLRAQLISRLCISQNPISGVSGNLRQLDDEFSDEAPWGASQWYPHTTWSHAERQGTFHN